MSEHKKDTNAVAGFDFLARSVTVYRRKALDLTGELAYRLLERFAVVAAQPAGEDTAGRQALRLMPPEEIVQRSFQIARAFMAEADRMGNFIALPDLEEMVEEDKAKRTRREKP